MKQKTINRSLIAFISIFILTATVKVIIACGGGDYYYEWKSSFFAPENAKTNIKQKTNPLNYSFYQYYKHSAKNNNINDYTKINSSEWYNFFNKQVSETDLTEIIYKLKISEIDHLIFKIKDNKYKIPSKLSTNSILKYKNTKTAISFLFYIGYAKRCEPYANFYKDYYWEKKDDPREDTKAIEKQIIGGKKLLSYCKDSFIKERYVFQITRLYYMKKEYSNAISFYDENENILSDISSMKYRALGYKAGAYYKQNNYAKANYLYSTIYDRNKQRKLSALRSFKPVNEKDWRECLSYAKNKREKCILWQMLGIYADPFRAMKQIYQINPNSKTLNLLLTRSINIFEDNNLQSINYYSKKAISKLNSNAGKNDIEYIKFVQEVAKNNNTNNKLLWNMSASYLSFFSGENNMVQKYLRKAKHQSLGNKLASDQIKIFETLLLLETNKDITKDFEDKLSILLNNILFSKQHSDIRIDYTKKWLSRTISNIYKVNNMPIKAHIANNHSIKNSFLSSNKNCKEVIKFLNKENKTKIERTLSRNYKFSVKYIYKHLAINYILEGQWEKSLTYYKKATKYGNNTLNAKPFDIKIKDCYNCNNEATNYTAISMLKEIIRLENESKIDKSKAAQNYFSIANACYNNSFFGANRNIYSTNIEYRSLTNIFYEDISDKSYASSALALKYYLKARENSTCLEFKAKCTFMAAKCELNSYFIKTQGGKRGEDFIAGKYFKTLKNTYINTNYYKEIIKECSYFNTFIKKK